MRPRPLVFTPPILHMSFSSRLSSPSSSCLRSRRRRVFSPQLNSVRNEVKKRTAATSASSARSVLEGGRRRKPRLDGLFPPPCCESSFTSPPPPLRTEAVEGGGRRGRQETDLALTLPLKKERVENKIREKGLLHAVRGGQSVVEKKYFVENWLLLLKKIAQLTLLEKR